ncbi:MAG: DUF4328 domain-containing protein [Deltaproteobacteria bacterium]|nr:MAG: DUF4328 domain-containing protein [Deltaproteobacteria bacterium]
MQAVVPLHGRAKVAIGGLVLIGSVHAASAVAGGWLWLLIGDIKAGKSVSPEAVAALVRLADNVDTAYWGALAIAVVTFLAWFYRAYANLVALSPGPYTNRPAAAIFAWFIPLLHLAWPYAIAKDIWMRSERDPERDPCAGMGLLTAWWAAWVVSGILGMFVLSRPSPEADLDAVAAQQMWAVIIDGLRIVAAILAVLVVRNLTRRQMAAVPAAHAA